jgi:N-acetyl sugar amidotransferase
MPQRDYQICTRCVMDTTDLEIIFNSEGECNLCTEFLNTRLRYSYQGPHSDLKFNTLLTEIKDAGKGKEYDCIVGLSGGIDSSYVAYICKKEGLRVLGVHVDNGWNSEEAVINIKNIAQKLQIDYESYVLDWDEFKDLQLAFLKASVPEAETPTDIALLAALHEIASKYGVKHIISGGNFATEGILPKLWHYDAKDLKYFKAIQKTFGTKPIRKVPLFGFWKEIYYKLVKKIKMIYLLNYIPYSKAEAIDVLKREIDWRDYGGKHHESVYTKFIQSYYLYTKFGIDYRRATLSSQICAGSITREKALEQLQKKPFNEASIKSEKEYIAKKLGTTYEELEAILALKPKWYHHYPNNEKKLAMIYDVYRKLFKKDKLGNF